MESDDDFTRALQRTDPWIAAITPDRVEAALAGFPLRLAEGWDYSRLASEIQDRAHLVRVPPPQGNAEAISELRNLSERADRLRRDAERLGETSETAVFWEVLRLREAESGADSASFADDYMPLVIGPLGRLSDLLARAASQIATEPKQTARWREKHQQGRRVAFAIALMPVFESAYAIHARAHNWALEYGEDQPWPDFFERVYRCLRPDAEGLNLPKVLQEAARERPKVEAVVRWLDAQEATRAENTPE